MYERGSRGCSRGVQEGIRCVTTAENTRRRGGELPTDPVPRSVPRSDHRSAGVR